MGSSLPKHQQKPVTDNIVEFTIKLPKNYYDTLTQFAKYLYVQPVKDEKGNIMKDASGKPLPGLPQPNIETLFVTCAINTYQVYQTISKMGMKQQ